MANVPAAIPLEQFRVLIDELGCITNDQQFRSKGNSQVISILV
jgi:hypothetical protein